MGRLTMSAPADGDGAIDMVGVSKRYGGVQALDNVTFSIATGTVHGLIGENGAGKSTLGKIIAGMETPDDGGTLRVGGQDAEFSAPRDAIGRGITIIAQEISLVPTRTVAENVFLGIEPSRYGVLRPRRLRQRFAELCAEAGFELSGSALVSTLSLAQQQKVEILRSLARDARVIVMDEPSAALSMTETVQLHRIIRDLRQRGTTIVYISHFLEDVLEVCDDVTVMRDGAVVSSGSIAGQTVDSLVSAMIGRSLTLTFPEKVFPGQAAPVLLSVRGLTRGTLVQDVNLEVRAGEIVGLAGLVGCGRSEIAHAIYGADHTSGGTVDLCGERLSRRSPHRSKQRGLVLLPESRKDQGLMLERSVRENVSLARLDALSRRGVIRTRVETEQVGGLLERLSVPAERLRSLTTELSGGNQQKVLFARWLFRQPGVFIVDEPTRGVDVGAKRAIYELLHQLAEEGIGILLISSELQELIGLAHRILVVRAGTVVAEFDGHSPDENAIMHAAFGTNPGAVA
jgi:simple sugar transport system ATP-binding protein/ribose transport system ATP-binding protein